MEYQCEKCHYRFESNHKVYACPYCGRIGTLKKVPTASELLESIELEEKSKEK